MKDILIEESNVTPVNAPVNVCGDIHGQFFDVLELFKQGGELPDSSYIFIGDFVDRGYNSVETFEYLMCLKIKYPEKIILLRGNHECRQITQVYGFYDEIVRKYGNPNPWKYCTDVFDYLPLGAIIEDKVFCVHGGLSPELRTIDQIRTIDRKNEIPHEGPFCDLMWSDPEDIDRRWFTTSTKSTGSRWLQELTSWCRTGTNTTLTYGLFEEEQLVTVWSAPNYCYRCGNIASILKLNEKCERTFITFKEVPESLNSTPPKNVLPYFL